MRKFGALPNEQMARQLVDYLLTQRILATTNETQQPGEGWELWVREEDQLESAGRILEQYQANPSDPRYQATAEANQIRKQLDVLVKRRAKLQRRMPESGLAGLSGRRTPVTVAIIVLAVIAGLITHLGSPEPHSLKYLILPDGDVEVPDQPLGWRVFRSMMMVDPIVYDSGNTDPLAEIRKGEIWRLITPALLHGSIMHLAFNMIMLYQLGGVIERLHGSAFLLLMFIATGIVATLAQAFTPEALGGTPNALGASGAIFGLFGYLWIRPVLQPRFPLRIPNGSVVMMIGWLLICMTPIIPNIANAAHVGGLVAGIAFVPLAIRFWPTP